ncbi:DNA-binding protein BIN4 [Tanacetum coccineum]
MRRDRRTLEGFSFESADEANKQTIRQADENEGAEPQTNGKGRQKAEKTSDASKNKGKAAVKKPAKKVRRKAQVAKKTKAKIMRNAIVHVRVSPLHKPSTCCGWFPAI